MQLLLSFTFFSKELANKWTRAGGQSYRERKRDFSLFSPPSLLLFIRIGSSWWLYQTGASANVTDVNEHFFLCLSCLLFTSIVLFCLSFFWEKNFSAWQSVSLHCQATLVRPTRLKHFSIPFFKKNAHWALHLIVPEHLYYLLPVGKLWMDQLKAHSSDLYLSLLLFVNQRRVKGIVVVFLLTKQQRSGTVSQNRMDLNSLQF